MHRQKGVSTQRKPAKQRQPERANVPSAASSAHASVGIMSVPTTSFPVSPGAASRSMSVSVRSDASDRSLDDLEIDFSLTEPGGGEADQGNARQGHSFRKGGSGVGSTAAAGARGGRNATSHQGTANERGSSRSGGGVSSQQRATSSHRSSSTRTQPRPEISGSKRRYELSGHCYRRPLFVHPTPYGLIAAGSPTRDRRGRGRSGAKWKLPLQRKIY